MRDTITNYTQDMSIYNFGIYKCTCGHHHVNGTTRKHIIVEKAGMSVFVCGHCGAQDRIR